MLKRKFYEELLAWKDKKKKLALLVDGARQIGKTTIIREFGEKFYGNNFIEINFLTTPSAKEIFKGDLSADRIILSLTSFINRPLVRGKTLIFFDEMQECPELRTATKFLVEDGRFDYIESGSLLGINYGEINSYPVGFEEEKMMHPLDFEEFAWASGVQESVFEHLRTAYENKTPVDPVIHKNMMRLFTYYMVVGGLPEAVNRYLEDGDMGSVAVTQRDIVRLYRKDIIKYAGKESAAKITSIFDSIPSELNAKNKRFKLADLSKSARLERYESGFNWLSDAGISLPCYNVKEPKDPLEVNKQHNLFKVYLVDTGLLCAMCSNDVQWHLMNENYSINEGSLMENVFATQLYSGGFPLYYYDKSNLGEVDFLLEQKGKIIPVEIKSGKDYKSHRALDNLLRKEEYKFLEAVVFCNDNVEQDGPILYLPFYLIMFLKRENTLKSLSFNMDFSSEAGTPNKAL